MASRCISRLSRYSEMHDGVHVIERTDNLYGTDGRLESTIARKTLPGALGTLPTTTAAPGDVKTTYTYDPSTRVLKSKMIASRGDASAADYCMDYQWTSGAAV